MEVNVQLRSEKKAGGCEKENCYCDLKIASIVTLKSNTAQKKIPYIQQSLTSVGLIPLLKLSIYPSALLDCVLR